MSEPIDVAAVRRKISKEARVVLELAEWLDYTLEWASQKRQAVAMRSQFDGHKLLLPVSSVNANRLRALSTQVIRHADPERVRERADLTAIANRNRSAGKIPLTFDIATDNDTATKRGGFPMSPAVERALNTTTLILDEEAAAKADAKTIRKFNDDDESLTAARTLVSETPWMVRKGGVEGANGRMYESHSVIHRVWSDGTEDYRCRFCSYTNDVPRAVSNHASRMKEGHPAQGEVELHTVNEYQPSDIKHPGSGVRRLTTELMHALDGMGDWCDMSREDLARALAEHVFAQRPDRPPTEPLTAEQIVHRITLMVDTGRLAEMHQQVERTAAALVESTEARNRLTDEVIAAQHEVERLREERKALAAMLSDAE